MTSYTREQILSMPDGELEEIVPKVMGWREDEHPGVNGTGQWMAEFEFPVYYKQDGTMIEALGYYPASEIKEALELQSDAIKHSLTEYIFNLYHVVYGFEKPKIDPWWDEINIATLLQATPRQQTMAAILTFQEQSGGTGE